MTTIVYDGSAVAYDSLLTQNDVICDRNYNKRVDRDGVKFFLSGSPSDYDEVVDAYFSGSASLEIKSRGIVVDNDCVYTIGFDGKVIWKFKERGACAIGSGECFALAAMDMGATAKEAVKIAIGRDIYSGGRIRAFKVK